MFTNGMNLNKRGIKKIYFCQVCGSLVYSLAACKISSTEREGRGPVICIGGTKNFRVIKIVPHFKHDFLYCLVFYISK